MKEKKPPDQEHGTGYRIRIGWYRKVISLHAMEIHEKSSVHFEQVYSDTECKLRFCLDRRRGPRENKVLHWRPSPYQIEEALKAIGKVWLSGHMKRAALALLRSIQEWFDRGGPASGPGTTRDAAGDASSGFGNHDPLAGGFGNHDPPAGGFSDPPAGGFGDPFEYPFAPPDFKTYAGDSSQKNRSGRNGESGATEVEVTDEDVEALIDKLKKLAKNMNKGHTPEPWEDSLGHPTV